MHSAKYIPKALLRRREKPLLIWLAPFILVVWGSTGVAFALLVLLDGKDAAIGLGSQAISHGEAVLTVVPELLLSSCLMLAAAYGFLMERPWARWLSTGGALFAYVGSILAVSLTSARAGTLIAENWAGLILIAAAFWYCYRYPRVTAYYQRLANRAD